MAANQASITNQQKLGLAAVFLLATIAIWHTRIATPPEGFWFNIFNHYRIAWAAIVGCSVMLLWIAFIGSSWSKLIIAGVVYTTAVGSVSLVFGVPYTAYDAWNHLGIVRYVELDLMLNPYPSLHSFLIEIHRLTGLPNEHLTSVSAVLAAYIGVFGLVLLINEVPAEDKARRVAFAALLPSIFLGFVSRPFTIAWMLVPFWLWVVIRLLNGDGLWPDKLLAIVILVASPFLHPMLLGFAILSAGVGAMVSRIVLLQTPHRDTMTVANSLTYLTYLGIVIFIFHMIILSGVGLSIAQQTVIEYITQSGPDSVQQAATKSGPFSIFTSIDALIEAILRFSLALSISIGVLYASVRTTLDRCGTVEFGTMFASAILWIGGFLILFIASSGLGIERIIRFTPLVLVPVAVRGFGGRKSIATVLAVCCLTTGLVTVYPSGLVGAQGYSASQSQSGVVEWTSENRNEQIVTGSPRSRWMGQAYDREIWRWEMRPSPQFPWLNESSDGLVIVLKNDIRGAEHIKEETGNQAIRQQLHSFDLRSNKVYSGDGGNVYYAG